MLNMLMKHPSLSCADQISNICFPLKKLNITYFAHVRISNGKKVSAIANHPNFTQHYLQNQYFNADIHRVDEKNFGNFFVWDGIEFTGKSAQICREAGEFGVHNPFTIIDRHETWIDYYHFANNSQNKQINQIYLTHLDLLNLFILHFKENIQQSKILSKAYNFVFDIDSSPSIMFEEDFTNFSRLDFINSLSHHDINNRIKVESKILSKRQSDIVRLVVKGNTMKEIAKLLKLSPRTVEHYFEMIKIKLNVSSRSELMAKVAPLILPKIFKLC